MDRHPSPELFFDFLDGRLSRRRNREVVRHLLDGCPVCPALPASRALGFEYAAAFDAVEQDLAERRQALARERAEAPEQLREIAVQPFYRQWIMVTDSPRFRTWGFCELLLDACRE